MVEYSARINIREVMPMIKLTELAYRNNGFITSKQAVAAGLHYSRLSEAVVAGELMRVSRGIYCVPEVWEDEYWVAQQRFSRGVLSEGTALFLHGYTDRTPQYITMTFPRSYNASGARKEGFVVRTCAEELLDLGLATLKTPSGNEVRAYNLERTLCDLVRGRTLYDVQILNPAMKRYVRENPGGVGELMAYADQLGVLDKIRTYIEVLL